MAQAPINFGPGQESSYEELGDASPRAINVIIDPKGVVSKRPGIATYDVAPSGVIDADGITGLYATNDSKLYAVGGTPGMRKLYRIGNGSAGNLSLAPNTSLRGTLRPTFAETEVFLVLAGGADMQKIRISDDSSSLLLGLPPLASHVIANSSRLLANDMTVDRTKVRFSGVSQGTVDTSGHENWSNTGLSQDGGFFTAEARPDPVMAVWENTNEVFVWGKDNLQIFVPDASNVFSPGAARESGTLAPHSIIKQGQDFFWLDQFRRIVYSDGRQFQNLEGPIKKQLDELSHPEDCIGYRVFVNHIDCLVWTFPTDGRTFAYQVGGGWSEWFGWSNSLGNFTPMSVRAHHLRRDGGINVVGTDDGRIGKFSLQAFTDLGSPIVSRVDSGFIDRDTDNLKRCRGINFTMRRGTSSTRSLGRIEWRDDLGPWNGPIYVDTGVTGDNNCFVRRHSFGTYRRRQWRFTFSDEANLSLVKATEVFEVLGN